jgi:hypothetical protein
VITALAVPLDEGARGVLADARTVLARAEELREVRGTVPPDARVEVLGPGALDDLEGHDWTVVQDSEHVVILSPEGPRFARLVRELRRICAVDVTAIPEPPPLGDPEEDL